MSRWCWFTTVQHLSLWKKKIHLFKNTSSFKCPPNAVNRFIYFKRFKSQRPNYNYFRSHWTVNPGRVIHFKHWPDTWHTCLRSNHILLQTTAHEFNDCFSFLSLPPHPPPPCIFSDLRPGSAVLQVQNWLLERVHYHGKNVWSRRTLLQWYR